MVQICALLLFRDHGFAMAFASEKGNFRASPADIRKSR